MRKVKIWYTDFWRNFNPETFLFTKVLQKHYEVIFDKENPDYVFCSHFGSDYLNYNGIRILFMGEAKTPDFNLYDYALAFDYLQFGDRYLRYPLYLTDKKNCELAMSKHLHSDDYYLGKKKFCNFVVSNGAGANQIRNQYFDKLNEYKQVDSGGGYRNNLLSGQPIKDKLNFQRDYRFSFAFENSAMSGYTTEKIIDAWAAETVPIYWGDPSIESEFNPKAFINCSHFEKMEELIETIKEMEQDEEKYLEMMRQPILLENSPVQEMLKEQYLEDFLLHIFEQDKEAAVRRSSRLTMWGMDYENRMRRWANLTDKWHSLKSRKIVGKILAAAGRWLEKR